MVLEAKYFAEVIWAPLAHPLTFGEPGSLGYMIGSPNIYINPDLKCSVLKTPTKNKEELLVGAQPPTNCSFARHLVGKMVIHCSFAHH